MDHTNLVALILSYVYVFAVIGAGEGLRRWRGFSPEFLRKTIHIGVGLWAIGTVLLFRNRYAAIIPPLTFVFLNYASYRLQLVKAMDSAERNSLGTVYFPIAFLLVLFILWDHKVLAVASLMPLTFGDAMAAVLGRPFGQYRYTVLGRQRSIEGSLSMFIFSLLALGLTLWLLPGLLHVPGLGRWHILGSSLATAAVATLVEAVTPWDLDNLTIPFASAWTLWLIAG